MSVIKNDLNKNSTEKNKNSTVYEIPAVIRDEKNVLTFETAVIISIFIHILLFSAILLISFVCKLLGINLDLFKKPDLKPKDIEFVLVEKEAPPIDKNTKNRADKNSRAGGKNDPKRPVSLPKESAPKSPAKKPTPPAPKKTEPAKQQPKKTVQQPQPQAKPQKQVTPQPQQPAPQPAKPAPKPAAPRPVANPSTPKPTVKPSSNFNIPIPKSSIPSMQPSSSPVTSAPKASSGEGVSGGSGSAKPSPSFSPTVSSKGGAGGNGIGQGGGGRFSNGTGSSSHGNVGNPSPGNPKGAPGIDAIKEPDFGPYMKELQRRIKMNWDPPKGDQSKRVILLFSIARDGRLLNVSVHRSSGLPAADKAAIDAVKLTAPFRPLPAEFKGNSVDIQFTFDYNVFGVSG